MKHDDNDQGPREAAEGWVPSQKTLAELVAIAPAEWAHRLGALAVREGFFASTPSWGEEDAGAIDRARGVADRLADACSKPSVNLHQIWNQLIAGGSAELRGQVICVSPPASEAEAFLTGAAPLPIHVLPADVWHNATAARIEAELIEAMKAEIASLEPGDCATLPPVHAHLLVWPDQGGEKWARAVLTDWAKARAAGDKDWADVLEEWVDAAAYRIIKAEGYERGPCPRCGRVVWYVSIPKPAGRKPLLLTYCPTCVAAIKAEQKTERTRRFRARNNS